MLPTTALTQTHDMPVCTYTIRKDEIDGPVLRYARVGEQVVHRWECQTGLSFLFFLIISHLSNVLAHLCRCLRHAGALVSG